MNAQTLAYWVTTAIVSLGLAAGGFAHLTHQAPETTQSPPPRS